MQKLLIMIHKPEDRPGNGLRRKYSKLSLDVVSIESEGSVLLSSIKAESVDVTVETFDYVQDADDNDFFKVEFE